MPFQDSQLTQSSTKSNSRKTLSNQYFLYFSAVYLFIFLLMQSSVRNTGKFKPFQFVVGHNFTTSSTIKISEYLPGSKLRSVQWRRKYEGLIQKMYHLDALCEYSCSQLDKDFTVEATIESELVGQNRIQTKINVYGPVNLQPEYSFLAEDIPYTNEDFEIDIIGNRKIYSCFISFISGQIYLKNKVMMSISPFMIPVSDLINCFVQKANGVDVVICPNFYLKVAMLKTFNEIMDNYTENFEPVMIKISDPRDFNPTIRLNAKWKRFLLRLNYLKQDSSRRMSMPQIMSTVVRIPPNQNEMKKISERYSEDTASVQLIENKIKPEIMKKSQTFERTNNKNERKGNFLQNQAQLVDSEIQGEIGAQAAGEQLFAEIQGVLYDENEPEQEVIELNDSFQQFENKSRSEKQMKKWQMVKANKKQREVQNTRRKQLQKTLQQLQNKHEQLMSTNQKLKEELQTQKNQNYSVMINTQRLRLANLRREYEKLLEETNKKYEEMNRIQNNMERSGKL